MAAGFEPERVVEVWAPSDGYGTLGSGYLLGAGLVLTARHVVGQAGGRCEARALGSDEWIPAETLWRGEGCDAALLHTPDDAVGGEPTSRLGRLARDKRAPCRAVGFPRAQARPDDIRDTEDLAGEIAPLSGLKGGSLTVHIAGSVPMKDASGHSPWEGMSGAALFSGPLIVGVVVTDPAHFGTDRLEAVPITAMAAEAGFREALTGDPNADLTLSAIEDVDIARGVLRDPYRPMPTAMTPETLRRAISFLVRPEFGVVPFHGRAVELSGLEDWCAGESGLEIALMPGVGGTGKTRLGAELCRRAQSRGAVAGSLEADAPVERAAALAQVSAPLLVVVDEAHGRVDQIAGLTIRLARGATDRPRRILLLARQVGEWWEVLLRLRLGEDPAAELAYSNATVFAPLAPVDDSLGARERSFDEAAEAFARRIGESVDELPKPDLAKRHFEQILYVHLAARSALEPGQPPLGLREELVRFALDRESRYWADTADASALGLDPHVRQRAVALATLTVAASEDEAARALKAVPEFADASQERLRATARWLRDLYPPPATVLPPEPGREPTWFRPLIPEPLGETLVAKVLEDVPSLPNGLLKGATEAQARRALTVLTQASPEHGSAAVALRAALADQLPRLWQSAMAVAQQAGDPLGLVLAEVLEQRPQPDLASQIAVELPEHSVSLRELAAVATRQALEATKQKPPGFERDAELASGANDYANRLADLGHPEEALDAIEEAVGFFRQLAGTRADEFRPHLAMSLLTYSSRLGDLGRRDEALRAIEDSVALYRELSRERPDEFRPGLAMSLMNYSIHLGALDRREQALDAIVESVALYRELSRERPDEFRPELEKSLINYAHHITKLGHPEEALDATEEAVAINRQLAEEHPDAFRPDLAGSLLNYSSTLGDLGRREEALEAIEESVALYHQLAGTRPGAFRPELAMSLMNYANRLGDLGHREEALHAAEESVALYRPLAEQHPDTSRPDLADSLLNLAGRLTRLGHPDRALDAIEEAVAIDRELAEEHPEAFRPALAASLNNYSEHLSRLGLREQALDAVEESVALYRQLTEERPDAHRPRLALSLITYSNCLGQLRRREQALDAVEEGVAIYRELSEQLPDAFLPSLAGSLNNYSEHLGGIGHREAALNAVEESVALYRQLAGERPDAFRPDLAMSLNNHSNRLSDLGRSDDALAPSEEAVAIYRRLSKRLPDAFLADLARSLNNYANILSKLGRSEEAHDAVEESVALYRQLAAKRPDAFRPALAGSLSIHSICLSNLERRTEALAVIEEAVAINRQLAEERPDAVAPDLAATLHNRSIYLYKLGRREEALAAVDEAIRLVLPTLEGDPHALPELPVASLSFLALYLELCEQLSREPDEEVLARMYRVHEDRIHEADPEGARAIGGGPLLASTKPDAPRSPTEPAAGSGPSRLSDPDRDARLNIEYQRELARWKALPWLKRTRTRKPRPPNGS